MRETERKKVQNDSRTKRPVTARTPRKETKTGEGNVRKPINAKESQSKASRSRPVSNKVPSDAVVSTDASEVYENVVVHYVDDSTVEGSQQSKGDDSDYESMKDSSSSQGDSVVADDEKLERDSGVLRKMSSTQKNLLNSDTVKVVAKVHPALEKDEDVFEEASNGEKSTESDTETVVTEDNEQESVGLKQKVEIMENRIEKLEEELREVAALEISLYSVVPEHGSSAHKVHTPARRLSRLYIHACKHWTRSKRATVARNAVSGLIMVSKTCGNDVARLTFWLSNTVVLREITSQAFGISSQIKENSGAKQLNKTSQLFEDWEETSTFTSALQKIESWIFSRVVESLWWQALTPNMLSPVEELINQKSIGKLLGPALGNQQQGIFSIELWKNAFQTAFQRLCPVRSAGHECSCLPVLPRMVMEQCFARLDVAMFNAILRESASQIPTDPVSDPIVDSRVLPIPAGEFSFGSGAQLKNAVGNWTRWFEDTLCIEIDNLRNDHDSEAVVQDQTKCFHLLNELSDLLMLPKDLLMVKSVREEVCPSINLDVIKRILCYFTPDEFCPDQIPGEVLEALNAESFVQRSLAEESCVSFPYAAGAVQYLPPSARDVSEKVAEAGEKPRIDRNVSMVQKKGYTSDDELDGLDSPLTSLIEPSSPSTSVNGKLSVESKESTSYGGNVRYALLREVWSA